MEWTVRPPCEARRYTATLPRVSLDVASEDSEGRRKESKGPRVAGKGRGGGWDWQSKYEALCGAQSTETDARVMRGWIGRIYRIAV